MFKVEKTWISPEWEERLKEADLLDIEAVSEREFNWFEAPNRRRGGWSGVTRIVLNPEAVPEEQKAVFLKIQQNHFYRAPSTCFRKRLSFAREFDAFQAISSKTNCLPKLLEFAQWNHDGKQGALIITEALDGWLPFDKWLPEQEKASAREDDQTDLALQSVAAAARELHQAGWAHYGFYPKHAFIHKNEDGTYSTTLIDLEKARQPLFTNQSIVEDVSRFLRHSHKLSERQKVLYLHSYFQADSFTPAQTKLIKKMRGAPSI